MAMLILFSRLYLAQLYVYLPELNSGKIAEAEHSTALCLTLTTTTTIYYHLRRHKSALRVDQHITIFAGSALSFKRCQ